MQTAVFIGGAGSLTLSSSAPARAEQQQQQRCQEKERCGSDEADTAVAKNPASGVSSWSYASISKIVLIVILVVVLVLIFCPGRVSESSVVETRAASYPSNYATYNGADGGYVSHVESDSGADQADPLIAEISRANQCQHACPGVLLLGSCALQGKNSSTFFGRLSGGNDEEVVVKRIRCKQTFENEKVILERVHGGGQESGVVRLLKSSHCVCGHGKFLILERVPGSPLEQGMFRKTPRTAARVTLDVSRILANLLNRYGIMHADVKLSNVIYNPENESVTLIDFGNSGTPAHVAKSKAVVMDPMFAPPEGAYGEFRDPAFMGRLDSWGVVLLFVALVYQESLPKAPWDYSSLPEAGSLLRKLGLGILARCLVLTPQDRPSLDEIVQGLAEWNDNKK